MKRMTFALAERTGGLVTDRPAEQRGGIAFAREGVVPVPELVESVLEGIVGGGFVSEEAAGRPLQHRSQPDERGCQKIFAHFGLSNLLTQISSLCNKKSDLPGHFF